MIPYSGGAFGFKILLRAHGSAIYKTIVPSVLSSTIYLLIFEFVGHVDATEYPTTTTTLFVHPYPMTALVAAYTFLLVFRANYSYNRWWEAYGACYLMHSRWLDFATELAAFHYQSEHYGRLQMKPPAFGSYPPPVPTKKNIPPPPRPSPAAAKKQQKQPQEQQSVVGGVGGGVVTGPYSTTTTNNNNSCNNIIGEEEQEEEDENDENNNSGGGGGGCGTDHGAGSSSATTTPTTTTTTTATTGGSRPDNNGRPPRSSTPSNNPPRRPSSATTPGPKTSAAAPDTACDDDDDDESPRAAVVGNGDSGGDDGDDDDGDGDDDDESQQQKKQSPLTPPLSFLGGGGGGLGGLGGLGRTPSPVASAQQPAPTPPNLHTTKIVQPMINHHHHHHARHRSRMATQTKEELMKQLDAAEAYQKEMDEMLLREEQEQQELEKQQQQQQQEQQQRSSSASTTPAAPQPACQSNNAPTSLAAAVVQNLKVPVVATAAAKNVFATTVAASPGGGTSPSSPPAPSSPAAAAAAAAAATPSSSQQQRGGGPQKSAEHQSRSTASLDGGGGVQQTPQQTPPQQTTTTVTMSHPATNQNLAVPVSEIVTTTTNSQSAAEATSPNRASSSVVSKKKNSSTSSRFGGLGVGGGGGGSSRRLFPPRRQQRRNNKNDGSRRELDLHNDQGHHRDDDDDGGGGVGCSGDGDQNEVSSGRSRRGLRSFWRSSSRRRRSSQQQQNRTQDESTPQAAAADDESSRPPSGTNTLNSIKRQSSQPMVTGGSTNIVTGGATMNVNTKNTQAHETTRRASSTRVPKSTNMTKSITQPGGFQQYHNRLHETLLFKDRFDIKTGKPYTVFRATSRKHMREGHIDPDKLATPLLFLEEVAHFLSLLSAVSFSTLRNDLQEADSPLTNFQPGLPWPHVDPDRYKSKVRQGWSKSNYQIVTIIRFLLGYSRNDEARTLYNASRPFRVIGNVSSNEIESLQEARGPLAKVQLVSLWLQELVTREHLNGSTGDVAPPIISRLYQYVSDGMSGYTAARKIAYIPFPFPHAQITTLFVLIVDLFVIPVLMLSFVTNAWVGFTLNLFTVMCFTGLHETAREVEAPFQNIPNDVPLNNFQAQFNESLMIMFYGYHPDAFWRDGEGDEEDDDFDLSSANNDGDSSLVGNDFGRKSAMTSTAAAAATPESQTPKARNRKTPDATPLEEIEKSGPVWDRINTDEIDNGALLDAKNDLSVPRLLNNTIRPDESTFTAAGIAEMFYDGGGVLHNDDDDNNYRNFSQEPKNHFLHEGSTAVESVSATAGTVSTERNRQRQPDQNRLQESDYHHLAEGGGLSSTSLFPFYVSGDSSDFNIFNSSGSYDSNSNSSVVYLNDDENVKKDDVKDHADDHDDASADHTAPSANEDESKGNVDFDSATVNKVKVEETDQSEQCLA